MPERPELDYVVPILARELTVASGRARALVVAPMLAGRFSLDPPTTRRTADSPPGAAAIAAPAKAPAKPRGRSRS